MISLKLVILFCAFFAIVNAACLPWHSGGVINVCKKTSKKECIGVTSGNTCKNLIGGPFPSGFSSGSYSCYIYSKAGCKGTSVTVDHDGWKSFPITPKSIKCPCV